MYNYSRRLRVLDDERPDVAADPIPEFCRQHRMSVALYYKLSPEQRPQEIRIGKKVLISREAAAAWRRRMEGQPTDGGA
jgi:hypothetical protein